MLSIICMALFLMVFFRLLGFAFKLGWGVLKLSMVMVVFPIVVISLILGGLLAVAFPLILIAGIAGCLVRA